MHSVWVERRRVRFTTHHNALDLDLYMPRARAISQSIVVECDRVYEIEVEIFRNEGLSAQPRVHDARVLSVYLRGSDGAHRGAHRGAWPKK